MKMIGENLEKMATFVQTCYTRQEGHRAIVRIMANSFHGVSYVSILVMGASCHIICHVVSMSGDRIRLLRKNPDHHRKNYHEAALTMGRDITWRFKMLEFSTGPMMIFK